MKFKCLGVKNYTIQNILEHKHGAGRPANILGSIKISVIKQITDDLTDPPTSQNDASSASIALFQGLSIFDLTHSKRFTRFISDGMGTLIGMGLE